MDELAARRKTPAPRCTRPKTVDITDGRRTLPDATIACLGAMEPVMSEGGRRIAWRCPACGDVQPVDCAAHGCYKPRRSDSRFCDEHEEP